MQKKLRKIPNPSYLANVALHYLQRFAASEASLRRVLTGRIYRAGLDHPNFAADKICIQNLHSVIETIIETHKKSGIINDAAFAEIKIHSLRRQGKSTRAIQQKLAMKGVKTDLVAAALDNHAEGRDMTEVEFKAALALAKKRRWGPYRNKPANTDKTRKEFAGLARAGFSSAIAKRVLNCDAPEEWE